MKIAIVADSTCCVTKEQQEKYQIEIVPVNVRFEGKVYKDWVDLSPSQAFQFIEKNPEDYATSAPSPGDFLAAYKKVAEKGAQEIICLTISSKLSATWNSARNAKELAKSEIPNVRIKVIDSFTVGTSFALLCLMAATAAEKGKSIDEIVKLIENSKEKVKLFISLETIRYIYRSGRVPEVASKIGALLPLKPILKISEGTIHLATATTSRQKNIEKLVEIFKKSWNQDLPEVGLIHADALEECEKLREKIRFQFPSAQIFISELCPVLGYVTGRGVVGIAFFEK